MLDDPSSGDYHLSPYLPLDFLPAHVTDADIPKLILLLKAIPYVLKVSGGHDEHLLVGEVDEFGISSWSLQDLLEFVDVGVEFLLQVEVVGDGFVAVVVGWKFEEVLEGIEFALLVAVEFERVEGVGFSCACVVWDLEDGIQHC
jgi:hypothetical protein